MNDQITKFEKWILRKIAKRIVIQSGYHRLNIIEYYTVITDATEMQFTEDNRVTLNHFLTECHDRSLLTTD